MVRCSALISSCSRLVALGSFLLEFVEHRLLILGLHLLLRLDQGADRRLGFAQSALLDGKLLFLLGQRPAASRDTAASIRSRRWPASGGSRTVAEAPEWSPPACSPMPLTSRIRPPSARPDGSTLPAWPGIRRPGSAGNCAEWRPAPGLAPGGAWNVSLSVRAALSRATLTWAAISSLFRREASAALMVGSSSMRTSPAFTVCPSRTWMARTTAISRG